MTNSYDVAHGLSQDAPCPLQPVEIAQQPGDAPATGNTARDQEMYAAGIRTGEENAKHNAAIRGGVPAGWKLVPITATDEMEVAAENDFEQTGYTFPRWKSHYAAMLAAAPASPGSSMAGDQQPARDWELTCHECDGSGHVYVKHQVAERKTDIQEFKEECECCEGRGFVFAFQDIPGIEEYVKACCPAPAAAGVSTVEDAGAHKVVIDFDQVGSAGPFYVFDGRVTIPAVTVMDLVRMAAPAAGDALDAARWRAYAAQFPEISAAFLAMHGTDPLPTIKGAAITSGYVVVTPAGWDADKATKLRDAILRLFPVNPAHTPRPSDEIAAQRKGDA